jgi:hypothetical protein
MDDNSHQEWPLSISINSANDGGGGEEENRKVKIKFVNPISAICHCQVKTLQNSCATRIHKTQFPIL